MKTKTKKVLVTSFGPFGGLERNPTEDVTAALPLRFSGDDDDIELITAYFPVAYDHVVEAVPALWRQHEPVLVINLGVNVYLEDTVNIERRAFNYGYCRKDVKGDAPRMNCCAVGHKGTLVTQLEVDDIAAAVNSAVSQVDPVAVVSDNPGRFLCGFCYFASLSVDARRAMFVHIPRTSPDDAPRLCRFTTSDIADIIASIIRVTVARIEAGSSSIA